MLTHFFECVQSVHCLSDDTFSQMINQDCLSYSASQRRQQIYPLSFPFLHSNCNCHPSISSHHVSVRIPTLDGTPPTTPSSSLSYARCHRWHNINTEMSKRRFLRKLAMYFSVSIIKCYPLE